MNNSNNVVQFPKDRIINVPVEKLNKEQIDEHTTYLKHYMVGEILELMVPSFYNQMAISGFPINENTVKDGALVTEAIRSLLLKYHNIDHPFQKLAEEMFTIDSNEDLTLTGNLSIITNTARAVGNN